MTTCPCCGSKVDWPVIADLNTNMIVVGDQTIKAWPQHVEIMHMLVERMPGVVRIPELMDGLWGIHADEHTHAHVSVLIAHIRKKLRGTPYRIDRVYHAGYRLSVDEGWQ